MEENKVHITKHDLADPEQGFFAVKFGKKKIENALSVAFELGLWRVSLNGYGVAPASPDWQEAFGWIYKTSWGGLLIGRRITSVEYNRIILFHSEHQQDPNETINLNSIRPPF